MPPFVNFAAIAATVFRSDRLGPLDSIAHPLSPGRYHGEVWRGDDQAGSFAIEVGSGGDGEQIDIDLSLIAGDRFGPAAFHGGLAKGQPFYAVFHCNGDQTGFHVVLRDREPGSRPFDSRALQPGDYYIVTPVRPGRWAMKSGARGGSGTLTICSPRPEREPRVSASGAMIRVDAKRFEPEKAEIVAGDGAVFEVTGTDVVIRLKLASEETAPKGRRKIGIRYPGRGASRSEAPKRSGPAAAPPRTPRSAP